MFLSDSDLLLIPVLKSIDSRFQNLRRWTAAGSFVTLCLPLMRKVAKPQVLTEGEITYLPICAGFQVLRRSSLPQSAANAADSSPIRWSQETNQVEPGNEPVTYPQHKHESLNLWAFMRGFAVRSNRTEAQNPRPLSLWGRGFVIFSAASWKPTLSAARQQPGLNAPRLARQQLAVGTADREREGRGEDFFAGE